MGMTNEEVQAIFLERVHEYSPGLMVRDGAPLIYQVRNIANPGLKSVISGGFRPPTNEALESYILLRFRNIERQAKEIIVFFSPEEHHVDYEGNALEFWDLMCGMVRHIRNDMKRMNLTLKTLFENPWYRNDDEILAYFIAEYFGKVALPLTRGPNLVPQIRHVHLTDTYKLMERELAKISYDDEPSLEQDEPDLPNELSRYDLDQVD